MSDTEAEVVSQNAVAPVEQVFRIVYLKLDDQGVPMLTSSVGKQVLPAKIYDRKTALKFATYEAQRLPTNSVTELLLAVISPMGRCIAVLAGGTGKPVRPLVAMRTKRALATLLPGDMKVRRRTSRPATRSVAKAARKRRMTGRGSR